MKPRFVLAALLSVAFIALAACGGTTTPSSGSTTPTSSEPTTVQVTLSDYKVQPSLTTFAVGKAYRFVVTNTGQVTHEFMAGPTSAAQASEEERDAANLFEVADVAPGQTKTLDYTFTEPVEAGALEFSCHEPGHYELGMRLGFAIAQ